MNGLRLQLKQIAALALALFAVSFAGCEETPKQPVLRPIPPPPPTPPPGVAYVPPPANSAPVTIAGSTNNVQGFEVTSNFVGNAQPAPSVQHSTQPVPQYEQIPPRPGPDYVWHDGFWSWNNGWAWNSGQWVYQPPSVIVVPGPGYYYGPHYYYGPRPYRYYHRW